MEKSAISLFLCLFSPRRLPSLFCGIATDGTWLALSCATDVEALHARIAMLALRFSMSSAFSRSQAYRAMFASRETGQSFLSPESPVDVPSQILLHGASGVSTVVNALTLLSGSVSSSSVSSILQLPPLPGLQSLSPTGARAASNEELA